LFSVTSHLTEDDGEKKALPPEFSIEYRQVPLVELVCRNPGAGGDNYEPLSGGVLQQGWTGKATVVAVSFSFSEVFQGLTLP
jgi:hypothetical protein